MIENPSEVAHTASDEMSATPDLASKRTGRRGILKAAAAGAAALGVAAVAVKGAPEAHAATGGNFILGNGNDADNVTYVVGTFGTFPPYLLGSFDVNQTGASATYGNSHSGYGVGGHSDTGVDFLAYGGGRIQQFLTGAVGAPTTGTYSAGEMIRDNIGDMYICVSSGSPGFWFKVAAFDPFFAGGAVSLYNPPFRLYDSRHDPAGPLVGSSFRDVFFGSVSGLVGNLTVTNTTANGYLVIYPTGAPTPSTSTVNYLHGQTNANSFIVGVGSGSVRVHNFGSGSANFIIDATGFIGED